MNDDNINLVGTVYVSGVRGYSAYEIAVQNGFVGTEEEWLDSLKGDTGETGATGATPNISIGTVTSGDTPSVTRTGTNENPVLNFVLEKGDTGETGNGIVSIAKTSTSGLVDTYTVTYDNGNTDTFDVTNGNGIASITKTGTADNIDTYTITYDNGNTDTFTVTNSTVTDQEFQDLSDEVTDLKNDLEYYETILNVLPKENTSGTSFTINDTVKSPMVLSITEGNTSQETNVIIYVCDGTETGDYYFVYDGINYQFTMPTISAGSVIYFNTDDLELFLNNVQISTTTASTGTLITMLNTPNPHYAQPIHVVTGDNTIIVSDGNNEQQTYSLSLGSLELCKVGTYADYIYKSGTKWYHHKKTNTNKVGTSGTWNYNSNTKIFTRSWNMSSKNSKAYCNYLPFGTSGDYGFSITQYTVNIKNKDYTDLTAFKQWVGSIDLWIYFIRHNESDTEITDSTLIGELNALEHALSYDNQTVISQINDDLSFVITATTLTNLNNS